MKEGIDWFPVDFVITGLRDPEKERLMSMLKKMCGLTVVLSCMMVPIWPSDVMATPYASGIRLNGANSMFILNQDAASVDVEYDGGALIVNMGALAKGAHVFDATLGATWEIVCTSNTPAGWTQISDDNLTQSKYYSPKGVTVDANPMRWTFGRIYVSEGLGGVVTAGGRRTTDGLYIMTADQADVTGQGDTAYAGAVDWTTTGYSPTKVSLNRNDPTGQDYTVYIGDWSDGHSGIWTADATNPSAAFNELLDNTGRDANGVVSVGGGFTPGELLHGSVPCGPWVEGTGASRSMYTVDEDVRRGNVLQYDIGTTTSGYNTVPTDRVTDGPGIILNGRMDVVRDEDGSWWIAQYRYDDSDSVPSLSHWADGASTPSWTSGQSTIRLNKTYGSIDIFDELDLLVMGTRDENIYVLDISDPANPVLADVIPHSGEYTHDVSFDAAGNIYVVNSSSETLRIYSPGGDWIATTGSDGTFSLVEVPEPATLSLLAVGGLVALRRRRV